jgi:hypothetical protein
MNMGDPYGSGGQKFPPLGSGGGIGYEANPGVPEKLFLTMKSNRYREVLLLKKMKLKYLAFSKIPIAHI